VLLQVAALFEQVQREQQRLDVLVNAAWGGNELAIEQQPFWQLPVQVRRVLIYVSVATTVMTSPFKHADKMLLHSNLTYIYS
jgi:NAD(P)-dependent dehydrogenase (short-subunit alcohol dehydrogenase family)